MRLIIESWPNQFAAAQRSTFTIPEDYTLEDIGNAFGEALEDAHKWKSQQPNPHFRLFFEETDNGAQTQVGADYTRG